MGITKKNSSESRRLISAAGKKGLLSISSVMCDDMRRDRCSALSISDKFH